jgi:hypothetical protein
VELYRVETRGGILVLPDRPSEAVLPFTNMSGERATPASPTKAKAWTLAQARVFG